MMHYKLVCTIAALVCVNAPAAFGRDGPPLPRLRVSENKRFLVTDDGKPFFWLGDTAWELFHRLGRDEASRYLESRARQGFSVIQAVAIAEFDGHRVPNAYGHLPLTDVDPARPAVHDGPENDYWDHVDFVIDRANALGLYVGLLPTWGRYWHDKIKDGKPLFTKENAAIYGRWFGKRYKDKGLVWILGGDRSVDNDEQREIIASMARGLREGDGGTHLITFHPNGGTGSSKWFHDADWLDFNLRQNGHGAEYTGRYSQTRADYDLRPVKPVIDGEPLYEGHPISFNAKTLGHSTAADIRRPFYWDLFGGACGHTYGHHSVWQMWQRGREPINDPLLSWTDALHEPGAAQMVYGRRLMESRPFLSRVPDDSVVVADRVSTSIPGAGRYRFAATRDSAGSYAMVYVPCGRAFKVRMDKMAGDKVNAWWFDPRTGRANLVGQFPNVGERAFVPPEEGEALDWVLVLDDAAKGFPPPGSVKDMGARGELAGYELLTASFRTGDTEIFVINPDTGEARNLTCSPQSKERYPSWSSDGKLVAFNSDRDGTYNLYVVGADGGNWRQLTKEKRGVEAGMQSWTADGRWIYFGLFGKGQPRMCRIAPDGSNFQEVGTGIDPAVSPDGRTVVFARSLDDGHHLYAMDADGKNERRLTAKGNVFAGVHAAWSPDGKWIVYADQVGDALEIFRMGADGKDVRQLTRLGKAATSPAVSPDGKWISFRLCDEIYWRDGKTSERAYRERRADKRPVWVMAADGANPHIIEALHYQTTIDGSRAPWRPR
jgi:hypothetical protein